MTERFKAGPSKAGGTFHATLTLLKTIHRAWAERRALRQAHDELLYLTDHELKDIGITRGEIRARVLAPRAGESAARPSHDSAAAPFTAAEVARLQAGHNPFFVPANQNSLKQRKVS